MPKPVTLPLPAVLYLLVLDNLGDSWEYGRLHAPEAIEVFHKTLEFAVTFPSRTQSIRACIRLSA